MAKRDFYEILGVTRTATEVEMKIAFRKAAMECHPDRNPGDRAAEARFKEVNEAYQALSDPQKRSAYDRFGHSAFEQGGGAGGFSAEGFGSMADIFEDLFGDVMGRRGGRSGGRERGSDLRYNMEITLEEAYTGKTATLKLPTTATCDPCGGTGAKKGSKPKTCATCAGHGRVRAQQGYFAIERTCPACHGAGRVIDNPCRHCGGQGRARKEKTLSVSIPPGVEDGTRIRLAGEGEAGLRGGAPGDLYIFLAVKPHRFFHRDGANIHCRVPISMPTASLGGAVEVPTVDGGRAKVNVSAGTQSGHQFRLRGKGMSVLRSASRGDMYVEVMVETPVNLTKRQQELLREFDKAGDSQRTHPESEGFFARVKEFFEDLRE
jgi:molecular chaperone DnaJ